jgi:hypothetical protein
VIIAYLPLGWMSYDKIAGQERILSKATVFQDRRIFRIMPWIISFQAYSVQNLVQQQWVFWRLYCFILATLRSTNKLFKVCVRYSKCGPYDTSSPPHNLRSAMSVSRCVFPLTVAFTKVKIGLTSAVNYV